MRFNIGFTPGTATQGRSLPTHQSINHATSAFIENKRYRTDPRPIDDVVNRNAASVYQTDAVLILIGRCAGAPTGALNTNSSRRNSTEYVDVQKNVSGAAWQRFLPLRGN
jgi:hypothetical protein